MKAKFQVGELLGIGLTLVVLGIALAYGLEVMTDVRDDQCDGALEHQDGATCYTCPNSTHNNFVAPNCANGTGESSSNYNVSATVSGEESFNATASGVSGVAKIPEKLGTIATVIVAAVIIGILITYLWGRFSS